MSKRKPFIVAARLSASQLRKLEAVAENNGISKSALIGVLADSIEIDHDLLKPIANGTGHDLPVTSAVSTNSPITPTQMKVTDSCIQ